MTKKIKADNSPVTETDLKINQMVLEEIEHHYPNHDVMSEEGSNMAAESSYLWICDPLDGTLPFSHGMPICTFTLALAYEGRPFMSVIYDPFMDRMFYAERGKGAYLNGQKIKVSNTKSIKSQIVECTGWLHGRYRMPEIFDALYKSYAKPMHFASVAYSASLIACGEFVGMIFAGETAHDIAAAKVLVEEAGGIVTDLLGSEQRYDKSIYGAIVSNGGVHNQLLDIIKSDTKFYKELVGLAKS
jgi:myo-inositol-1(or 4)-monophosphatase